MSQARCTTTSAPRNNGTRSARDTTAAAHSTFDSERFGSRRAIPSTESTSGSAPSAGSTLVPTFPVAPVTTTRIPVSTTPPRDTTPPLDVCTGPTFG